MKVCTNGSDTHLVKSKSQGQAYAFCGRSFKYEGTLTDAQSEIPTCPRCLKFYFANVQTNYHYHQRTKKAERRADILTDALGTLIRNQQYNNAGDDCEESKKGAYPFIPMSIGHALGIFEWLSELLKKEKRWSGFNRSDSKFLDAGCGIGNIMLLASLCSLTSEYHGIEFFEKTAERGRTWLGLNSSRTKYIGSKFNIFQDDILTFKNYSDYNIIYFYCPMFEARLQIRFEERLEDEMHVGAVLVPRMKRGGAIRHDDRFEKLTTRGRSEHAFIKIKGGPRKESELKVVDRIKRHDAEREKRVQKILKAGTIRD